MATFTLEQLTATPVITEEISRIKTPQSRISRWLGMNVGGARTSDMGGRYFSYDVYNKTRNTAPFRAPGSPPGLVTPNPVGNVPGVFPRIHAKLRLTYERIWNNRPIGSSYTQVDAGGQNYIKHQTDTFAQLFMNTREFMVARMLRGSFSVLKNGDDWIPVDSGGNMTIDFQIPASNKSKLNMIGAGDIIDVSWSDINCPIFQQLNKINAAFEQLHGFPLRHVWVSSVVWNYVLMNLEVKSLGGTSNTPFAQYERVDQDANEFVAVLRGIPWLQFHIYDGGLNLGVSQTFTKLIDDTHAIFLPEPSQDWVEMLNGSEPVVERLGAPVINPMGFYVFSNNVAEPASVEITGIDNCIPSLKVPSCVAYGLVAY
jgi:hypothetical protein